MLAQGSNAIEKYVMSHDIKLHCGSFTQFSIIVHNKARVVECYRLVGGGKVSWPSPLMDRRLSVIIRQTLVLSLSMFNGAAPHASRDRLTYPERTFLDVCQAIDGDDTSVCEITSEIWQQKQFSGWTSKR
ncbi:hypothetical protein PUN28_002642 [Cardiocondyla obscurior]|uniref:Uncharacterized protein n=1 Tax=Cardiocondyla obscurior TaxID=286306 RepID=A0AAW2GVL6_9HYME